MNLGIFLSPGDSLTKQNQSGQLDRLVKYYLSVYAKHFDRIHLFSYGDSGQSFALPKNLTLIPKPGLIPNYLYQLILPFLHREIIRTIDVFRVFQAPGGLPALTSKILFKKPYVISNNYDYVRFAQVENRPFLANLLKLIVPLILKHAGKIINPKIIPNGVDPLVFTPNRIKQEQYLILSIGRLVRQKNYELLIKTVSSSRFKNKIKLIIIGKGPLQEQLLTLAEKLKVNLQIISNVEYAQLVSWYQKATVFALTSRVEGQSKVLLEAMSCACACLTADFIGNMTENNVTGLIGANFRQLARQLDRLLSDPDLNRTLGRQARRLVVKQFDLKKMVQKEIKLLQS